MIYFTNNTFLIRKGEVKRNEFYAHFLFTDGEHSLEDFTAYSTLIIASLQIGSDFERFTEIDEVNAGLKEINTARKKLLKKPTITSGNLYQ